MEDLEVLAVQYGCEPCATEWAAWDIEKKEDTFS